MRVAFASSTAVVYTLHWPPGAQPRPLPPTAGRASPPTTILSVTGLILLFLLIAVLAVREFARVCFPLASWLIRPLTVVSRAIAGARAG